MPAWGGPTAPPMLQALRAGRAAAKRLRCRRGGCGARRLPRGSHTLAQGLLGAAVEAVV
jgi:hypothetical protein